MSNDNEGICILKKRSVSYILGTKFDAQNILLVDFDIHNNKKICIIFCEAFQSLSQSWQLIFATES